MRKSGEAFLGDTSITRVRPLLMTLVCVALTGCVAGPNFQRPAAPDVSGYAAHPVSETPGTTGVSGGDAQRFVTGADIPGDWWTLFHSPSLNDLI